MTADYASPTNELTGLLKAWSSGDQQALEKLAPRVQGELHRIAARYMGRERPNHPLQATALINEAYMRLIDWKDVRWQNRAHFFAVSARRKGPMELCTSMALRRETTRAFRTSLS